MSDARNMVKCITRIWRMYKRQESLFRSAMFKANLARRPRDEGVFPDIFHDNGF